ncbi:MAG: DUF4142 domain-containing protein [Ferruginibacter sp.]
MKIVMKPFVILATAAMMFSCNNDTKTSGTANVDSLGSDKPAAMDTTVGLGKTSTNVGEQQFLNYLVSQNDKEIASLDAAIAKGLPNSMKESALIMLKDHSRLDENIKYFLSMKTNLKMPVVDAVAYFNNADSANWEKVWAKKMMESQGALLDSLKKAKTEIADADFNRIITQAIPVISDHVAITKRIAGSAKK